MPLFTSSIFLYCATSVFATTLLHHETVIRAVAVFGMAKNNTVIHRVERCVDVAVIRQRIASGIRRAEARQQIA